MISSGAGLGRKEGGRGENCKKMPEEISAINLLGKVASERGKFYKFQREGFTSTGSVGRGERKDSRTWQTKVGRGGEHLSFWGSGPSEGDGLLLMQKNTFPKSVKDVVGTLRTMS